MQRDDIKERIKVELEKFKLYVWLTVFTIGGTIGLVFKEGFDSFRFKLIIIGIIVIVGFSYLAFYSYFNIERLFKQLEDKDNA